VSDSTAGESRRIELCRNVSKPQNEMSFRYILTIVRTLNDQILVVAEPAYQGTQAGDFMGFERNPMKSYRELDLTHFTSRYILLVFSKQTKHSK